MLTTLDFYRILKRVRHFGGVYSYNRLPLVVNKPKSIVINLDPSYKEGSHWVAVYFDNFGRAFYFDSYGRKPEGNILTFIERNSHRGIIHSQFKYQTNESSNCGYFVVLFILLAKRFNYFIKLFEKCKGEKNEKRLKRLIKKFID